MWLLASTKWKNVEPEEHAIGAGVTVMIPVAAGESVGEWSKCVVHIGG